MKNSKTVLALALSTLFATQFALAKNVNLYDQPKADAKVVGTVDSEVGIIPILTPKDSSWIKAADPRNGNVGWIKTNDLSGTPSGATSITVSQHRETTNGVPQTFQVLQFGNNKISTEQANAMYKQMQLHQKAIQQDMQNMMHDMFNNSGMPWPSYPVIVPVIMVPPQQPIDGKKVTKAISDSSVTKKQVTEVKKP